MNDATFTAVYHVEVYREDENENTVCIHREFYVVRTEWADDAYDMADTHAIYLNRIHAGDFADFDRVAYID